MIVSHKHKFIFLKTKKTAGTSIESVLSSICGPQDVITPFRASNELKRLGRPPQNYRIDHPAVPKRPLWRRLLARPERYYHPSVGYYEHMPAWRVKAYVGDQVWNSYFKFAFDRNPWDRQVSWYYYKNKEADARPAFDTFLAKKRIAYVDNFEIYSLEERVAVDFLGRFENLAEDFDRALSQIGLLGQITLPHINASDKGGRSYRSFYSDRTRQLMAEWYAPEIQALDYQF